MGTSGKWLLAFILCLSACHITNGEGPTITPSPYWKGEIQFPDDPFRSQGMGAWPPPPGWVKFTILAGDLAHVYFQDCNQYVFHYDFAKEILDPYAGISRAEFDHIALYEANQELILGAVIFPPLSLSTTPEFGIEFVRQDAYPPEQVAALFNLVKSKVTAPPSVDAFYFPTFEQLASAEANRDYFAAQNIQISSSARWLNADACYSEGWAMGRLNYVAGEDIQDAFMNGTLLSSDILLTDGVPAEIPFVAGILTLAPSTPNSHVAIYANTYGVPFAYIMQQATVERAQALVGHTVILRAYSSYFGTDIRIIDVEGQLPADMQAEILALKAPAPLNITPIQAKGSYSASIDGLTPADIRYFGGKASNMGLLRTAIPDNSPVGTAFSFDLWTAFMDQTLASDHTLREEIQSRLAGITYPPASMTELSTKLAGVRDLIRDTSVVAFPSEAANAVLATLQDSTYGFDPTKGIRFRSSTNMEDSEQFTGAGLYDSYTGCLADDLDGDETGPCLCDSTESKERGVFRAIRKVFASFYNDNAYLERLRYGIDETQVGMAILAHHAYPDSLEKANGVATFEQREWDADVHMVTQLGAASVTNPEGGAIPEEVEVNVFSGYPYASFVKGSSLVPLGATVMTWDQDYTNLGLLMDLVSQRFAVVSGKAAYTLDFEYKKMAPDDTLEIKQVREVPRPSDEPTITPFLLNEPTTYATHQGEFGDVFANHRLKCVLTIETRNLKLTGEAFEDTLFTNATLEFAAHGVVHTASGFLSEWPHFVHTYADGVMTDEWRFDDLPNPRHYSVTSQFPALVAPSQSPVLVIADAGDFAPGSLVMTVDYVRPVPTRDWEGFKTTTSESVMLMPNVSGPQTGETLKEYQCEQDGVSIDVQLYWPPDLTGMRMTAPLGRWKETAIEGLTTEPIVLRGYYSQTYRPEHHNFGQNFVFEPRFEPGIDQQTLDELKTKNIQMIYCYIGEDGSEIVYYPFADDEPLHTDVDDNGDVNAVDVQLVVNAALGIDTGVDCDVSGDGAVNAVDLQIVINAALGLW